MTSRNTAVYRYRGVSMTVCYRRAFLDNRASLVIAPTAPSNAVEYRKEQRLGYDNNWIVRFVY